MATVRIVITLKPGVLDAQGQAVHQGLRALGYETISGVRVGKCIELTVPDQTARDEIDAMCERFLANPLIEEWRVVAEEDGGPGPGAGPAAAPSRKNPSPPPPRPRGRRCASVASSFLAVTWAGHSRARL